jgi:hypothetical protein
MSNKKRMVGEHQDSFWPTPAFLALHALTGSVRRNRHSAENEKEAKMDSITKPMP